jgi:hypothetical protein
MSEENWKKTLKSGSFRRLLRQYSGTSSVSKSVVTRTIVRPDDIFPYQMVSTTSTSEAAAVALALGNYPKMPALQ